MTKRKAEMNVKLPLVVILGATGSGKTKLSLELAKKFGGEIIGADSMQVYKALDVITAKATAEEQKLVPHHLIDILGPHETFTVIEYKNKALKIITDLFSKNKLPIVVGGTNYYIESLLWKILIQNTNKTYHFSESNLTGPELHKKLQILDPEMAERLHPNNKRKILRSLEVLEQEGRKHSEIIHEQQNSEGGSALGGGLRYSNSIIFWLQCEQTILDKRLNDRVDSMVEQGLLEELTKFHKFYNAHRMDSSSSKPDYTKGIFQSIGFKEFHDYLMLNDAEKASEKGTVLFNKSLKELKLVTRRYARKQMRWITNRFLGHRGRDVPPVYGLNTDDVTKWEECVSVPATEIIENYLFGRVCLYKKLPFLQVRSNPSSLDKSYVCEVCERVFVGTVQWEMHLKSYKHKRVLERKQKLQKENLLG